MAKIIGRLFFQTYGFLTTKNFLTVPILRGEARFCSDTPLNKNLYAVLGLTPKATKEEIKSAYYKLSQVYHPDKHSGDKTASEKFVEIKEAHELLSDPIEREKYDAENFPKHSRNSCGSTGIKKEFKFHYNRPKKDPYVDYADKEYVKNYTRTVFSNAVDQHLRCTGRVAIKRKRRDRAQKYAYNQYFGMQNNAKMLRRLTYQMCNIK